jgi:hypothetical protein
MSSAIHVNAIITPAKGKESGVCGSVLLTKHRPPEAERDLCIVYKFESSSQIWLAK